DARMAELLCEFRIELVLTAHPTEAKRRTVLSKLQRIGEALRRLQDPGLLPRERTEATIGLRTELTALWLTDRARTSRPAVTDEVRTGLYFLDEVFWDLLPRIATELEEAVARHYPGLVPPPAWLTVASWIGGDRDGNPAVVTEVTAETLRLHRGLAVERHRRSVQDLARRLSVSGRGRPPPAGLDAPRAPRGPPAPPLRPGPASSSQRERPALPAARGARRLARRAASPARPRGVPRAALPGRAVPPCSLTARRRSGVCLARGYDGPPARPITPRRPHHRRRHPEGGGSGCPRRPARAGRRSNPHARPADGRLRAACRTARHPRGLGPGRRPPGRDPRPSRDAPGRRRARRGRPGDPAAAAARGAAAQGPGGGAEKTTSELPSP